MNVSFYKQPYSSADKLKITSENKLIERKFFNYISHNKIHVIENIFEFLTFFNMKFMTLKTKWEEIKKILSNIVIHIIDKLKQSVNWQFSSIITKFMISCLFQIS